MPTQQGELMRYVSLSLLLTMIVAIQASGSRVYAQTKDQKYDEYTGLANDDILEIRVQDLIRRPQLSSSASPLRLQLFVGSLHSDEVAAGVSNKFDMRMPDTEAKVETEDGQKSYFVFDTLESAPEFYLTGEQINRAYHEVQRSIKSSADAGTPIVYFDLFPADTVFPFRGVGEGVYDRLHIVLNSLELRQLVNDLRQGHPLQLATEDGLYHRSQELEKGLRLENYPPPQMRLTLRLVQVSELRQEIRQLAEKVASLEKENQLLQKQLELKPDTTPEASDQINNGEPDKGSNASGDRQ